MPGELGSRGEASVPNEGGVKPPGGASLGSTAESRSIADGPGKYGFASINESWHNGTLHVERRQALDEDLSNSTIILSNGKISVTGTASETPQLVTRLAVLSDTPEAAREQLEGKSGFTTTYQEGRLVVIADGEPHERDAQEETPPSTRTEVELAVPRNKIGKYELANGGDIAVRGVTGRARVTVRDGEARITDSQGDLRLDGKDSSVIVDKFAGPVDIRNLSKVQTDENNVVTGPKPTILKDVDLVGDSAVVASGDIYTSVKNDELGVQLHGLADGVEVPQNGDFVQVNEYSDPPVRFVGGYLGRNPTPEDHALITSINGKVIFQRSREGNGAEQAE